MALSYDQSTNEQASGWYEDIEAEFVPSAADWQDVEDQRLLASIETANRETKLKAWEMLDAYVEGLRQTMG